MFYKTKSSSSRRSTGAATSSQNSDGLSEFFEIFEILYSSWCVCVVWRSINLNGLHKISLFLSLPRDFFYGITTCRIATVLHLLDRQNAGCQYSTATSRLATEIRRRYERFKLRASRCCLVSLHAFHYHSDIKFLLMFAILRSILKKSFYR